MRAAARSARTGLGRRARAPYQLRRRRSRQGGAAEETRRNYKKKKTMCVGPTIFQKGFCMLRYYLRDKDPEIL